MKNRPFHAALSYAGAAVMLACAAAANALPSDIPFKTTTPSDDNLIYRAVAAFLLACLAAYGIAWGLKRYLPQVGRATGKGKQLERLEAIRLNQRSVLMRVRWHDEELLIGENEHSIELLGRRPLAAEAAKTDALPDAAKGKDAHD